MEDQELQCIDKGKNEDCEGTFVFTARDQEFFAGKGYTTPKRCKPCRIKKKAGFESRDNQRKPNEY